MMGLGEKPRNAIKTKKCENQEKISHWLPSHPLVYEMEPDCFPVSKNTENKPDLP